MRMQQQILYFSTLSLLVMLLSFFRARFTYAFAEVSFHVSLRIAKTEMLHTITEE